VGNGVGPQAARTMLTRINRLRAIIRLFITFLSSHYGRHGPNYRIGCYRGPPIRRVPRCSDSIAQKKGLYKRGN
jgi:hypothetical protein